MAFSGGGGTGGGGVAEGGEDGLIEGRIARSGVKADIGDAPGRRDGKDDLSDEANSGELRWFLPGGIDARAQPGAVICQSGDLLLGEWRARVGGWVGTRHDEAGGLDLRRTDLWAGLRGARPGVRPWVIFKKLSRGG